MIKDILLVAAITCSPPQIINESKTWTKEDKKTLEEAKQSCADYTKRSDSVFCLDKFIKMEDNSYQYSCTNVGKKKKE